MRAVRFYGVGDLRVQDVAPPGRVAPGMARLRVRAAGICGSDLHNFRTGQWVSRLPVTPGHELAGEVLEIGEGVAGFAAGDLAVADSRVFCGDCGACRAGRHNLCQKLGFVGEVCDGGFAEEVLLPASGLVKVPEGVAAEVAAMAEPLAVAIHAVRRLDPVKGEPVLIAGGGPIGGLAALVLASGGFGPVFVIERNLHRAALLAAVTGASRVELSRDAILRACGGAPRFCLDATGSGAVVQTVLESVAAGGRLALVGIFHDRPPLNLNLVVEREIEIVGCSVFRDELKDAVGMLPGLADKLARLASAPIGLADVPAAYETLIAGDTRSVKTIIQP
jgi:(R,R)-butanediol dehydrogenase/meso-butanediol dehydrogenase/diacetyl reductase